MDELLEDVPNHSHLTLPARSRQHIRAQESNISKLIQKYHKRLVLWSLIYPTPDRSQRPKVTPNRLHQFVNSLSLLADIDIAGATVASIAAQDVNSKPQYLVAANGGLRPGVLHHLNDVMSSLAGLATLSKPDQAVVENQILVRSVTLAGRKVKNYLRRLYVAFNQVKKDQIQISDPFMLELFQEWSHIYKVDLHSDESEGSCHVDPAHHVEACILARIMGRRDEFRRLKIDHRYPSNWYNIHHYIERLGSWHKASELLVIISRHKTDLVSPFEIEEVPATRNVKSAGSDLALADLLNELWPQHNAADIESELNALRKVSARSLVLEYSERASGKTLQAHSECTIADYFYSRDLKFYNDDRYIGCSKPSCYGCDKYLRFHPGRFTMRPTHENVWPNWLVPSQNPYTENILTSMIEVVENDIRKQYQQRRTFNGRPPDSAAGTRSTVIASLTRE